LQFVKNLFSSKKETSFATKLKTVLGFKPKNITLFQVAFNHRSVSDRLDENNERLEFLGDAILGSIVAEYLYKKYPYKGEGFLTEMRSKMVNRVRLNEIGIKMGLKQLTNYNKIDSSLRTSQIFGNTLEALVGAVYLEKGYPKTYQWIFEQIITPHFVLDELELVDINIKNRLYGWASKNNKVLDFVITDETRVAGRRLFNVAATIDGEIVAEAKAYNKKEASQIASKIAIEKLGLITEEVEK
jgi:ribonuclease III